MELTLEEYFSLAEGGKGVYSEERWIAFHGWGIPSVQI